MAIQTQEGQLPSSTKSGFLLELICIFLKSPLAQPKRHGNRVIAILITLL
jgi:hypothetical protein